jgi:hypothetical protein
VCDYCFDIAGSAMSNLAVETRPTSENSYTFPIKLVANKGSLNNKAIKFIAFINDVASGKSCRSEFSNLYLRNTNGLSFSSPSNTQLKFTVLDNTAIKSDYYWLTLFRGDMDLISNKAVSNPLSRDTLKIDAQNPSVAQNLSPGKRYIFDLKPYMNNAVQNNAEDIFYGYGVVTCSCPDTSGIYPTDQTGRPIDQNVVQKYGFVSMKFTDNSFCEEAHSFTRSKKKSDGKYEGPISYASNYYYYSTAKCGDIMMPGQSYADDLSLSRLDVGSTYSYCVQAVAPSYMADKNSPTANLMSSTAACTDVRIAWEASIQGLVTSKASAGSVPIQDVVVTWNIGKVTTNAFTALSCSTCSGVTTTDKTGSFRAEFRVDEPNLVLTRTNPVAVLFNFSRSFGTHADTFLANNEITSITKSGYIVYLKHLQFDMPLFIVDASTVPFMGKVYYRDTGYESTEGCPVTPATVCALQTSSSGTSEPSIKQLACQDTDSTGSFNLPLPVGSVVHNVTVSYYGHEFVAAPENTWADYYSDGVEINPTKEYSRNNFIDISTAPIKVDVAGGLCNKTLGTSFLKVTMKSCPGWQGKPLLQSTVSSIQYVPAAVVDLMVTDIKNATGNSWSDLKAYFSDKTVTLDLRKLISSGNDVVTKTTSKDDPSIPSTLDALSTINKAQLPYARFQYDGGLKILLSDLKDNTGVKIDQIGFSCSLTFSTRHVVPTNTQFSFNATVYYKILPGITCTLVEDGMKIDIVSDLAYEKSPNFNNLDKEIQGNYKNCSRVQPCSFNVTHVDGKIEKVAGVYNAQLWTGLPNILSPYTKTLTLQATGHKSDGSIVQTTAIHVFIITGPFTVSEFGSVALPTHTPILILRDPPGGGSTASYSDVVSVMELNVKKHDEKLYGKLTSKVTKKSGKDGFTCQGVGLENCDITKVKVENYFDSSGSYGGSLHNVRSDEQTTHTMTYTWSYTTSSDPLLAGRTSDVFVGTL